MNRSRCLILSAFLAVTACATANGALVLEYNTINPGNPVVNTGTSGTNGTFYAVPTIVPGPSGTNDSGGLNVAGGNSWSLAGGSGNLTVGINTNQLYSSLVSGNGSFTAQAWVKLNALSGDNMVFGTTNNAPLQIGFRDLGPYLGFWTNSSQVFSGVTAGSWNFWTWRYNGATGVHDIFRNAQLIYPSGGHAAYANGGTLTVGTSNANGGDFNGSLANVRWFNEARTTAQVEADFAAANVPEPGTIWLAAMCLVSLAIAGRRRMSK